METLRRGNRHRVPRESNDRNRIGRVRRLATETVYVRDYVYGNNYNLSY